MRIKFIAGESTTGTNDSSRVWLYRFRALPAGITAFYNHHKSASPWSSFWSDCAVTRVQVVVSVSDAVVDSAKGICTRTVNIKVGRAVHPLKTRLAFSQSPARAPLTRCPLKAPRPYAAVSGTHVMENLRRPVSPLINHPLWRFASSDHQRHVVVNRHACG